MIVALEPWPCCAEEADALGKLHFAEVERDIEPRRKYRLDHAAMHALSSAGLLLAITARIGAELIGYSLWTMQRDPEAADLVIAEQGPWFVREGFPRAALRLWTRSLLELRRLKISLINVHHRTQGRGKGLGKFYERQGAVHVKDTYQLWIG